MHSWSFNLENETNLFNIDSKVMGQTGYMLLYYFQTGGGEIALTEGPYSDMQLSPQNVVQKLGVNQNIGFLVYVELSPIDKSFTKWSLPIFYEYPGSYYIKIWLQYNRPFDYNVKSSATLPVVVTDSNVFN